MTCYFQIKRCLSRRWQAGVVSCILVGQSEIRFRLGINFNSEEIIWDCFWNNLGHVHVGNQFQFRRDNLGLFLKWFETFSYWKSMDGITQISENWPVITYNLYIEACKILHLPWKKKGRKGGKLLYYFTLVLLLFFNHCIDAHCSLMLLLRLWWKWKTWGKNFKGSAFSSQVACQCTRSLLLVLHCLRCYCLYEPRLPNPPIRVFH